MSDFHATCGSVDHSLTLYIQKIGKEIKDKQNYFCRSRAIFFIQFVLLIFYLFRTTFASQITSGVAIPFSETRAAFNKGTKNSLYVMLRRYRGLQSQGYGVKDKTVLYEPFQLVLSFREAPDEIPRDQMPFHDTCNSNSILLIICAIPVKSVYSVPDEILLHRSPKFSTRHTATGILTYIDGTSVSAFGYLPQDIIGQPIMNFYHPEDLVFLKDTYEMVMKKGQNPGATFCGRPYRFKIQNGCYVTLETEWTSFVNPWSRKLEFVIGNHRVLQGPKHCDIFSTKMCDEEKFTDEIIANGKRLQDAIFKLLLEPVSRSSDTVKQQVSKRCQALASFMEILIEDVARQDLKLELPLESELTASERGSVMLGEISPHHDYYDSKSSSETPPTYNQLNYNENLNRFFNSKPTTTGSDEAMKIEGDQAVGQPSGVLSPVEQCFEESGGSGSAGNSSTESNVQMDCITNTSNTSKGTSNGSGQPLPTLTEELLSKHNDDMEKFMLKRHKEARFSGRIGDKTKKGPDKSQEFPSHGHGIKRSGSKSWVSEVHKNSKQYHVGDSMQPKNLNVPTTIAPNKTQPSTAVSTQYGVARAAGGGGTNEVITTCQNDLWPPFSVSLTTNQSSTFSGVNHFSTANGLFPAVYYIPASQTNTSQESQRTTPYAVQYMTGLMYPSLIGQHLVYPHPSFMYQTVSIPPIPTATTSSKPTVS